MSSENKFEGIIAHFGFDPREVIGQEIEGWTFDRYLGHGTIGVVFHAVKKDIGEESAIKIIPRETLKEGWDIELKKLVRLEDINQVVRLKIPFPALVTRNKLPVVCIAYQYINGLNLKDYAEKYPESITLDFIYNLLLESLRVFQALKVRGKDIGGITHGDLHEGNIMIALVDDAFIETDPQIKFNDFGIGGSTSKLEPRDDYLQLSRICTRLIEMYVDPAVLDGKDRFFRNRLLRDFLSKQLVESDPTMGEYVRNPKELVKNLEAIRDDYQKTIQKGKARLQRPFDYLSCEQIGDSFELLQKLYSEKFPGYDDLLERTNTLLTGPRGCGKSTIFRNLSLKTQLLAEKKNFPMDFIGIYYNCNDLYYAFPYSIPTLGDSERKAITHYFNLAVLVEILETLAITEDKFQKMTTNSYSQLQGFLSAWFQDYVQPPAGVSIMNHLLAQVVKEKEKFRSLIDRKGMDASPAAPLPQDFLQRLCKLLQTSISWLKDVPFYIFLDDYSLPRVSKDVQATLNCFILTRYSELYFKISIESIVSIYPYDATGKMLEETREFDVIDLGDYFLFKPEENASEFLCEVINSRLREAKDFEWDPKDIVQILGPSGYDSFNHLARTIKQGVHVKYGGWTIVVNLCSGDVAQILRLVRNMFTAAESRGATRREITIEVQDKVIRETGSDFLNKVEAIPDTGRHLRKVVTAFGTVANFYLKTRFSKNVGQKPPLQASRIEIRESPSFGVNLQRKDEEKKSNVEKYYRDLIKYGIFIQDIRGKSQRGAVVPRLYLRRILIPTFVLTPSKRDSIGVDPIEFDMMLSEPDQFVEFMKAKSPNKISKRRKFKRAIGQKRLDR